VRKFYGRRWDAGIQRDTPRKNRKPLTLHRGRLVVVTLMTWVAPESLSKWAAPSEPSDAVYRAQHLHLY